jgi:hypothetical protein
MIVLLREFLSGFAEFDAARTVLGEEAPPRIRILGQLARDARAALAPPLALRRARRSPSARAKAAARNCPASSAVCRTSLRVRRYGRSAPSPIEWLRVILVLVMAS